MFCDDSGETSYRLKNVWPTNFQIVLCLACHGLSFFFLKALVSSVAPSDSCCFHHFHSLRSHICNDTGHRSVNLSTISKEQIKEKMSMIKLHIYSAKSVNEYYQYIVQKRPALFHCQVPLPREIGIQIGPGLQRELIHLGTKPTAPCVTMIMILRNQIKAIIRSLALKWFEDFQEIEEKHTHHLMWWLQTIWA